MTILQALQSINAYPIASAQIEMIAAANNLDAAAEADAETLQSAEFKRCMAQVYNALAEAPNISQGGISFSFTSDERNAFRASACRILNEVDGANNGVYGYIGEDF